MADVFLSYSSADRELTRGLDAELVAAGYTVYWDDMLLSGERFQDALTAQINAAVAVVVIWTPSSVRSDWVYSEARRGVEQKKVVQVRTRDLAIDDLPAPFDAFHCPFLDDTDAVLRAVRSLAEPGDVGDLDARRSSAPLAALPTGTVTLVMAEAEASAQQIRDLGPSWLQILEQQREVCRSAWRAHRGRELKAESTSFSVVFATADDAVAAALDAQRSLRTVTHSRRRAGGHPDGRAHGLATAARGRLRRARRPKGESAGRGGARRSGARVRVHRPPARPRPGPAAHGPRRAPVQRRR